LDDPQAIGSVLQRELNKRGFPLRKNVKVYNAGKSGDHSDDHVAMIVHRILHLEPDMIILFSGVNDLLAAMRGFDYLHTSGPHGNRLKLNLILRMAATEFQIPRRIDRLANRLFLGRERQVLEEIKATSNYREKAQLAQATAPTEGGPSKNLSAYRNNLLTIAGAVKNHGVALIFMTQASTWNSSVDPQTEKWQWLLYVNGVRYRADRMDRALESYNDVMREVARKHKTPVYDLARLLPKTVNYLYDDVHFNANGARLAASGLADFIVSNDASKHAH
jgi:lysophospholipase L1-like esterase